MDSPQAPSTRPNWLARHPRIAGALLLLAMHIVLPPLGAGVLLIKPEAGYFVIGIAQLPYAVPALLLLKSSGRVEMAKGMLFAAIVTFVLNAAGCAALLWSLRGIS